MLSCAAGFAYNHASRSSAGGVGSAGIEVI
jgi:hypothetical protein